MANKTLQLKIITPERLILDEMVEGVSIPTTDGEITILPEHIPLIAGLASGDVVGHTGGEDIPMAVVGGFVEVKKNEEGITTVAILADFAEHVSAISDEEIEKAKAKAEELKKQAQNKENR